MEYFYERGREEFYINVFSQFKIPWVQNAKCIKEIGHQSDTHTEQNETRPLYYHTSSRKVQLSKHYILITIHQLTHSASSLSNNP